MKLCVNCNYYIKDGVPIFCGMGHWESIEPTKTKIFNPSMFECIDYETDDISPNFGNDIFFDVVSGGY